MIRNTLIFAFIIAQCLCVATAAQLEKKTLLDFDSGSGLNFPGWTFYEDVTGYGVEGWRLDGTAELDSGQTYSWGYGPRVFNKYGGYGESDFGVIDPSVRSPSDVSNGGSFKVGEPEGRVNDADNMTSWWVWYDGKPLSEDRGITTANTNRMSFYILLDGLDEIGIGGGSLDLPINYHIGTYLCWYGVGTPFGSGDGCPYEGPGQQHYYHYFTFNSGGWIHTLVDQHPTHKRDEPGNSSQPNNPVFASDGKNYFEQLHQMYFEIRTDQQQSTRFWLDEIEFYYDDEAQNEESITNLWVGYWETGNYFEIGFQDASYAAYDDYTNSTFEIRWSESPITNANYASATRVVPLFYGGAAYTGEDYLIKRANSYGKQAWTRFTLPEPASSAQNLYFAVKDVSVNGGHVGSLYPYNRADSRDSPSSLIKSIDFVMPNNHIAYTVPSTAWTIVHSGRDVLCSSRTQQANPCSLDVNGVYSQITLTTPIRNSYVACISSGCTGFPTKAPAMAHLQ